MLKKNFDRHNKYHSEDNKLVAEFIIGGLANRLLENLYVPNNKLTYRDEITNCWITDSKKITELGLDNEPINWGDLKCCDVEYIESGSDGAHYRITIDEAAPDACPNLCDYISSYLTAWGWRVDVVTEW